MNNEPFVITPPPPIAIPVLGLKGLFPVRRIYCVGRNYAEHIREFGGDERQPPFFFQKPTDAIELDGAKIAYPSITDDFQHEVELVLAIGQECGDVARERAVDYVFGQAVGIDLTRRDVQVEARKAGRPWEIGKSFDRSAPIGLLQPLQGKGLLSSGPIELSVNGELRQQADLAHMIWNSAEVISQLSMQYRLKPGDLIYTGTPAGVGPLERGDIVKASIAQLSPLTITII